MARLLPSNPLRYLLNRQYDDRLATSKQVELIRGRLNFARNLYKKDLTSHYGCVNAIEFSNKGEFLVSGGDDRRVLIWNLEQAIHGVGEPMAMQAQHLSNIFCLGFDSTNSKVFSGGNDDQVLLHDVGRGTMLDNFLHEQPVYGISIDPLNDNVFASACDDGRILIYDIREPPSTDPFCLAQHSSAFHGVMFNPVEPRVLTTANAKEGVGLWDVRKPKKILMHFGGQNSLQSCMSVRFNSSGTKILALRRRLPPVIYVPNSTTHLCQFDHAGYYNSCTMKSCSFAGDDDQYILSGSDNFNLYMWKVPNSEDSGQWIGSAHMVLEGHRSIVNQVRFDSSRGIIASSGVEKLIKLWSPFKMPYSTGSLYKGVEDRTDERKVYTHEEYINLVLRSGEFMSHDYTSRSTQEDPRMMAFFDSLVQREIEGWSEDGEGTSDESVSDVRRPGQPATASGGDSAYSYVRGSDLQALAAAYVEAFETMTPSSDRTVQEPNRISQLIARKRAQLMRLAQPRFTSPTTQAPNTEGNGSISRSAPPNNYSQPGFSGSQDVESTSATRTVTNTSNGSDVVRKRKRMDHYSSESDSSDCWTSTPKIQKCVNSYEIATSSSSDSDNDDKNISCLAKIYGRKRVIVPAESCTDTSSSDEEKDLNCDSVIISNGNYKENSSDQKSSGSDLSNLEVNEFVKKKSFLKTGSCSSNRKKSSKCAGKATRLSRSESAVILNATDVSPKAAVSIPKSTNGEAVTVLKTASYESFLKDNVDSNCPITQFYDSSSEDEDYDDIGLTVPNSKLRSGANSTPDSGIAMEPCCSKSSVPFACLDKAKKSLLSYDNEDLSISGNSSKPTNITPGDLNGGSDWTPFKRLKSRLRAELRNYRRHMNDSDSN